MFDPIAQGLAAVSTRSPYAAPLVFAAGALSSIGPCIAPRFIAVAGLAAGNSPRRTATLVAAFIAGLTATYASFGAIGSLLGRAVQLSPYTYLAVTCALAAAGFVTLWRGEPQCSHGHERASAASSGAALLLGASFALVVSPCCTPLVLGIVAYASAAGSPAYGSALLACFALGHAAPIAGVAFGANRGTEVLRRHDVRQAAGVVSSTLMLALAAYYAVLA